MRELSKLRISVTEACQMRCRYCMPEYPEFPKENDYISLEKLFEITEKIVKLGSIKKIRITGGEPLLRRNLIGFIQKLTSLNVEIGLTTNGILLDQFLDDLKDLGVHYLNISLDSLNFETIKKISPHTNSEQFHKILENIELALTKKFKVKINTVVMSENFSEINHLAAWAFEKNIHIRFLELMSMGEANKIFQQQFVPHQEIKNKIESYWGTLTRQHDDFDSTSMNFKTINNFKIGFIASETQPFCESCSRMRLSAKGELYGCLMNKQSIQIDHVEEQYIKNQIEKAWSLKPMTRIYHSQMMMNQIGG